MEMVVVLEGLDMQQVYGQDLVNYVFMGGVNGICCFWYLQQVGVFQQLGVYGFQGCQQVVVVGGVWQDYYYQFVVEDFDDDFVDV